ncbi:MAG TPA: hypothetical protein VJH24_05630 [Candidatus Bilamarchaeaceae archaeon]|nr:hypothetical protein [Candidatus Bilamarchaeaceae archaeon]
MSIPLTLRRQRIQDMRISLAEKRMDFYRQHKEAHLFDEVERAIASRQAPDRATLKRFLDLRNERIAAQIADFEREFGSLEEPDGRNYDDARKECVDARPLTTALPDYLDHLIIHERTAAAIVRRGHVFEVLGANGVGFVMTHSYCGGEGVAYEYHNGRINGNGDHAFEQVRHIVESIPRGIATEDDPTKRSRSNARIQTTTAVEILGNCGRGNSVFPLMFFWEGPDVDVVWLSISQSREHGWVRHMRATANQLHMAAQALGRSLRNQFAHSILYYDPYRLRRFSDPRISMDALPNEMLCVPDNFRSVIEGRGLSPSAVGSLRYAGFLEGGHVEGVGGPSGNRHVIVLDPDPAVTLQVETALINSAGDIRDLSQNGESITRAQYDPATRRITFLD